MNDQPDEKPSVLSRSTLVPISGIVLILSAMVTGGIAFTNWAVKDALWKGGIQQQLDNLSQQFTSDRKERWRRSEQELWSEQLRSRNPSLDVPPLPSQN